MATASSFRRWMNVINSFLFVWLFVTCLLSWNVAIGHALVLRLDAIEAATRGDLQADSRCRGGTGQGLAGLEEGSP